MPRRDREDSDRPSLMSAGAMRFERISGRTSLMGDHIQRARVLARREERAIADRVSEIGEDIADEITKNAKVELGEYRAKMPSAEIHVVVDPPRSGHHRPSLRHSLHEALATKGGKAKLMLAIIGGVGAVCGAVKAVIELMKVVH